MRRVMVLIETSRAFGRGLLRGVNLFNAEHGRWSIFFQPHGIHEPLPAWTKTWTGDGILARIFDRKTAQSLCRLGRPMIDLRGEFADLAVPFVGVDNRAVGQLAADHLLERGLRHFAFCGLPPGSPRYRAMRCDPFVARVRSAGGTVHVFPIANEAAAETWDQEQDRLADWAASLPKPVGIMACQDDSGLQLIDACRRANLRIPDDVAVVSVDNDELQCLACNPPMSSVDLAPERVGYEAAAVLERMMNGEAAPSMPVLLTPGEVVVRRSSDILAIEDDDVAAALRHIRQHACEGLRVGELAAAIPLSRHILERRFGELIGRSPKAEITRVQLEQAKRLLATTDLTLSAVATKSGFRDAGYLCQVFAAKLGLTPGAYRRQAIISRV